MPNQALEQTRDNVLRYGEVKGCQNRVQQMAEITKPRLHQFSLAAGLWGVLGGNKSKEDAAPLDRHPRGTSPGADLSGGIPRLSPQIRDRIR